MNYLVTDLDTNANCDDNGGVDDAYVISGNKQARKLQATLVRNYDLLAYLLTGVKCRATSVAKKTQA